MTSRGRGHVRGRGRGRGHEGARFIPRWIGTGEPIASSIRCPWPINKYMRVKVGNTTAQSPIFDHGTILLCRLIPQEVILQNIIVFCDAFSLMQWRRVCRQWNEFIFHSDHTIARNIWSIFEYELRSCIEGLMSLPCTFTFLPIYNINWPNGEWESNGRKISTDIPQIPHNYVLLNNIACMLINGKDNLVNASGSTANNMISHNKRHIWNPIIVKHDTIHDRVPFRKSLNNEAWSEPYSDSENVGGLAFTTVKKLFRFPDEEEYKGVKYENLFDEIAADSSLSPNITDGYRSLKQWMENKFDDVSIIRMSFISYYKDYVSLYMWLGVSGSYLGGFWWIGTKKASDNEPTSRSRVSFRDDPLDRSQSTSPPRKHQRFGV